LKQLLRYALKDIWRYKLRNFILFIQILAAILLISFIFSISLNLNSYQNKLNEIMQGQDEEIYLSIDISSREKFDEITYARDSIKRQNELYKFMKENPSFKTYTAVDTYSMWLSDSNLDNSFTRGPLYDPNDYFLLKIDEEFQSVYKLKCAKGRLFSANDFKDTGNEIPLLLGYDFQKYYNLDDKIYDDGGQCYRVVGFLEKSSFYINPLRGEEISWLNRAFIIPLQPDKFEEWDYNSAIYSTFIITDDPENLRAIQEKSNELNLYTFEFRSFTEQLQMRLEGYHYSILIIGFITAAILFFAVTGFILNLIQFIKTHTKEFENHLLSGGRIMPIILRILIQVFIIIFLSGIIVAVIHKLLEIIAVPYFYRPTPVTLLTILASLLIGLVIVIYPMVMLSRIQKNSILKRSQ